MNQRRCCDLSHLLRPLLLAIRAASRTLNPSAAVTWRFALLSTLWATVHRDRPRAADLNNPRLTSGGSLTLPQLHAVSHSIPALNPRFWQKQSPCLPAELHALCLPLSIKGQSSSLQPAYLLELQNTTCGHAACPAVTHHCMPILLCTGGHPPLCTCHCKAAFPVFLSWLIRTPDGHQTNCFVIICIDDSVKTPQ